VFGRGDSNPGKDEHRESASAKEEVHEDSKCEPEEQRAYEEDLHHECAKRQDADLNRTPHGKEELQQKHHHDRANEGDAGEDSNSGPHDHEEHRECATEVKEVSSQDTREKDEPQGNEDSNGEPHQEAMQQVRREHCDNDDAGELNLKPCNDAKEILKWYAASNCLRSAQQQVMVNPIRKEDVVEDSNPRPNGHVCTMEKDVEFEQSTDKDVLDTTHRNDIGVWDVSQDPPHLLETANAGCMRSPRLGSFGRVQFQDETPGQGKCCWMQQCNDFSWVPWYKDILQWYQPKNSSQVKRLTRQQQK